MTTIKLDKTTRDLVKKTVETAMREVMEASEEKWLTTNELSEQYPLFTKDWLRHYGHFLPRRRLEIVDIDGITHHSQWCYPKYRIARMIHENSLKFFLKER